MNDGPALPSSARGLLVTGEGPGLDRAQLASARLAARTADEVRWIGVIERDVLEDAYRYRTVSVDVETAYDALREAR